MKAFSHFRRRAPGVRTRETAWLRQGEGEALRAVVTRVKCASVRIEGTVAGAIEEGLLVLLGVEAGDTEGEADKIADRICGLRIFEDEAGKMNRNLADAGGAILIVSQFTLYGDCRQRRPGFTRAARPETAIPLYERCVAACRQKGFLVETGVFGADMQVYSVNDGPVTLLLDTEAL